MTTAAIILFVEMRAVEDRFFCALVDFVVNETQPERENILNAQRTWGKDESHTIRMQKDGRTFVVGRAPTIAGTQPRTRRMGTAVRLDRNTT